MCPAQDRARCRGAPLRISPPRSEEVTGPVSADPSYPSSVLMTPTTRSSPTTAAASSRSPPRAAARPRRPVPRLHARRRRGLARHRRRPGARRRLHVRRQHRRGRHRRHRRARPRRHRPGRGAAGDGGQGAAVQALRRRRRGAGLPGDRHDVDEIVGRVVRLAPTFGGINLEDISAPRCFEVERRLQERLDIPVFHDDQHGTAIVVLAALHQRRARSIGRDARRPAGRRQRRRRGRRGRHQDPAARRGRATSSSCDSKGVHRTPGRADLTRPQAAARRRPPTRAASPARWRTRWTAPTSSSGCPAARCPRRPWRAMAHGRDRLRAGQPRPRGATRSVARPVRRGGRHRSQRLPEPDQQRAGVPGRLPRRARRAGRPGSPRA